MRRGGGDMVDGSVRTRSLIATLALLLVSLSPAPAGAAPRGGQVLPFDNYFAVAVDHVGNRVFVTGGFGSNTVAVLDYQGHVQTQLSNLPNAAGMVIVGRRLYIAREDGAAIDVVNLDTFSRGVSLRLPYRISGAIAYARGRLWTNTHACGYYQGDTQVGHGQLQSTNPRTATTKYAGGGWACPLFRTSPLHPNWLFAASTGSTDGSVVANDVSSGYPKGGIAYREADPDGSVQDFSFSPDGRRLQVARAVDDAIMEYRISDGAAVGGYPTALERATSVATTDAGAGVVALGHSGYVDRVRYFRPGGASVVNAYNPDDAVAAQGMTFVPEAGAVFVFTDPWDEPATVSTFPAPGAEVSWVSLTTSRDIVTAGRSAELTGRVALDGSANRTVQVYAQPFGQGSRRVASTTADADGRFRVPVTPSRTTTYVAHWTGDAGHVAVTSPPKTVRLRVITTLRSYGGYQRVGKYRYFGLDRRAPLVAEVLPHQPRRQLTFRVQRWHDGAWRRYETAVLPIPSDGTLEAAFLTDKTGSYRIRAEFDAAHVVGDVSPWRYLRFTPA
jgi:WD40 repeat protein